MSNSAEGIASEEQRPRRVAAKWLLPAVWLVLTASIVLGARSLPWRGALDQVRQIESGWLVAAVLANVMIIVIWAQEWRLLAPGALRVRFARMFEVVSVAAAVLNSVPFFAGEATGAAMLVGRAGLSRGAAISVLAMDQLLTGVVKVVLLAAAALLIPIPSWLRAGVLVLVVGVAILLGVLVPLAHQWEVIRNRLLERPSVARRLAARLVAIGRHLDAVRETHRASKVTLLSIVKKGIELLAVLAVQMAFGFGPSLPAAALVLAALAIATMIPVAPANLGFYEAAVFGAYRYVGVSTEAALGMALVQHLCFLLPMLATGYVTLTLQHVSLRQRAQ
ncbi:MAG TPA: lysylphosphatidylglycerol synthase transmembrane domain-containing protein [Gemmatimonadaceae bacterium]|nr:lysylphosphatidylglycerol synthase transmembrane domain-containing protein [Gemmatimonadaceae bacterium]